MRAVWANPILWREIRTRAYGRWPFLVQAAYYLVFGLICYWALSPLWNSGGLPNYFAARGLVPLGILSLLLLSAKAATAIASERGTGALDLLLVTDLTPKEFIFGKLWGILYNAKSYVVLPLLLAGVYAYFGMLATPPRAHPELAVPNNIESLVSIDIGVLVLMAFAAVLGVHVSLRNVNSQLAIINTLGTIFFSRLARWCASP